MTLLERFHDWRERAARSREIAHIPAAEMEGFGVTLDEFRALALMPRERIERMEAMARLHGVATTRSDLDRDAQVALATGCLHCRKLRRCRNALARGAGPEELGFCPNHDTWTALAAG